MYIRYGWIYGWKSKFYGNVSGAVNVISDSLPGHMPHQMNILNMAIPILMHFCACLSLNLYFISILVTVSHIKLHVIQQNVM